MSRQELKNLGLALLIIVICWFGMLWTSPEQIITEPEPVVVEEPALTTQELIVSIATEYDVCPETALRIAECESQYGKYPHNWEGSSAKGVYQFIDKTWKHYCEGDVLNEVDNITCFMRLYNKNPNWWACQ
jgi:hypothetical protein